MALTLTGSDVGQLGESIVDSGLTATPVRDLGRGSVSLTTLSIDNDGLGAAYLRLFNSLDPDPSSDIADFQLLIPADSVLVMSFFGESGTSDDFASALSMALTDDADGDELTGAGRKTWTLLA